MEKLLMALQPALLHVFSIAHEKGVHERNCMRLLMKDYSTQLKFTVH